MILFHIFVFISENFTQATSFHGDAGPGQWVWTELWVYSLSHTHTPRAETQVHGRSSRQSSGTPVTF